MRKSGVCILVFVLLNVTIVSALPLFTDNSWNKWLTSNAIIKIPFLETKTPSLKIQAILAQGQLCDTNADCKSLTQENGTIHLCNNETRHCEQALCTRVRDCTKFMGDSKTSQWFCRGAPGQCIQSVCTDPAAGKGEARYYQAGGIQYKNNPSLFSEQDFCIDDYTLFEKRCNNPTNAKENSERYFCEGGCKDGSCQPSIKTERGSCIDTGGGVNYFKKNDLLFYGTDPTAAPRVEPEYCQDSTTLIEQYCDKSGEPKSEAHLCELGCEEGACILPTLKVTEYLPTKIPTYFIEDYDNTLVVDGIARISTITRRFLKNHENQYDFLVVMPVDYPGITTPHTSLFVRVKENPAKGLGHIDNEKPDPTTFGSTPDGRLQGIAFVQEHFGLFHAFPEEYAYKTILEEITHNWAVGIEELSGLDSQDTYHWSRGMQSLWDYDGMRGARPWKDNHDGTFSLPDDPCNIATKKYSFSPFTLYLMGLADPKEITQNFLFIESPELRNDPCKQSIQGRARKITITDLINFAGQPRTITSEDAQKKFSIAFLIITPKDYQVSGYVKDNFAWLANTFPEKWAKATSCRSTINNITISKGECLATIFPKR